MYASLIARNALAMLVVLPLTATAESTQPPRQRLAPALTPTTAPSDVVKFGFVASGQRVLAGTSGEIGKAWNCTGKIKASDWYGRVAVLAVRYQNGCYGDGRYNHNNFRVERGVVTSSDGKHRFEAYRIHPPAKAPSQFLGSHHALAYRFAKPLGYTIYAIEGGVVQKRASLAKGKVSTKNFVKLPIMVSRLPRPTVFFAAPSHIAVQALRPIGNGASGGRLSQGANVDVLLYKYKVSGQPIDTRKFRSWADPSIPYAGPRNYFPVKTGNHMTVLWQDEKSDAVYATSIDNNKRTHADKLIATAKGYKLGAATSDGAGTLYFTLVQRGNGAGKEIARNFYLASYDMTIGRLQKRSIDARKKGLNITVIEKEPGSLVYANGKLGAIFSRTMHKSGDGLNHQGGIAVVFDAKTLTLARNHGQSSGHSFDNVLRVNRQGEFVGIDLGDNYPRGINLHKFTPTSRKSAIVYTFKTRHGQRARSPAGRNYPAYPEISTNKTKFYKWSNDNSTYTELGGVEETSRGYAVVFSGEHYRGRSLNNGRATWKLSDSRNIGFILVRKDFEKHRKYGNEVQDAMILSRGISESGGFYTFGGNYSKQRNTGVVWLTKYQNPDNANATRVKTARLANGNIAIVWEKWGRKKHVSTHAMLIDENGRVIKSPITLGKNIRLSRRDDLFVNGNDLHIVTGNGPEKSLEVVVLRFK